MASKERWISSVALATALLIFSPAGAKAEDDFVRRVQGLDADARRLEPDLAREGADRAAINTVAKRLLRTMVDELDVQFAPAVGRVLDRLQTPSAAYLQTLKDEIDADLRRVRGTSDARETPLRDPKDLTLDRIDPVVRPLLIAHLRAGNPTPVVELLELVAAYATLPADYLRAKHAEWVTDRENASNVPWEVFLRTQESLEFAMVVARTFFPALPDFSYGQAVGPDAGRAVITPFLESFVDVRGALAPALAARISSALQSMSDATAKVETYRLVFFPRQAADAQLRYLAISMYATPGADDCIHLASGLSLLDGETCRPATFRSRLRKFLRFFDQNADHGVMQLVLMSIRDYRAGDYGAIGTAEAWRTLRNRLENVGLGKVSENVTRAWPRIVQGLLAESDPERRDPRRRNLRALLEDDATGLEVFRLLKLVFLRNGIGVREEHGRALEEGFAEDYTAEVSAVRAVEAGFRVHVEQPLENSSIADTDAYRRAVDTKRAAFQTTSNRAPNEAEGRLLRTEALLDTLEAKTVRFDATNDHCEFFRTASPTDSEKRLESPWVVNNERTARREPTGLPTSNGFQRLVWFRDARFSNALTVQNADRPKKMFAGIAVRTAVGLIVPNVVHARMLMEDFAGEVPQSNLRAFGIASDEKGVMGIAGQKYLFPDYDSVVFASKVTFREMIRRFGFRKGLLDIEGQERMEPRAYLERLNRLFEGKYADIQRAFAADFRREMAAAAVAIRKWDERIERVKSGGVDGDAPTLVEELFPAMLAAELRRTMGRGPEQVNEMLVEMNDLFKRTFRVEQRIADGRIAGSPGRAEILRLARAMEVPRGFQLTPAQYREQFWRYGIEFTGSHLHKELLGFMDNGLLNGRGEVIRQRMHEHSMNIRDRRLEYMEYAKNLLLYRFPALKLNDGYKVYTGGENQYRQFMRRYLDNAVSQANKFQRFAGRDDEDDQAEAILAEVMPNLPLIDVILKFYPDQKAFVCKERHARGLTEAAYDAFFRGASYVGMGCALIGALGTGLAIIGATAAIPGVNVIAAIGVGIFFVCALASSYRAYEKWKEVDAARSWELAAQPQLGFEQDVKNMDYIREMEKRYDEAWFAAAVDVTLLAASVIPGIKGLQQAAKATAQSARVGVVGYFLKLPLRLFTAPGRELIAAPLKNWKLVADWTKATLRQRFTQAFLSRVPNTSGARSVHDVANATRRSMHAAGFAPIKQGLGFLKDILVELPWSLIGRQWANTTRAHLLFWGITAADLAAAGYSMNAWATERAQARVMDWLYANPEEHEDLVALMRSGRLSNGEFVGILEIDRQLSTRYMAEVQRQVRLINDNLDLSMQGDAEAERRIVNARRNIDAIYDAMQAELDALPADAAGTDPRYWAYKRKVDEMRVIRGEWAQIHRNP